MRLLLFLVLNHFQFPYGIIETGKDGKLVSLPRNPITYNINSECTS